MRQNDPIFGHQAPNGQLIWYVTRYDDVVDILKDHERFVKDYAGSIQGKEPPTALHRAINKNMLFADPPDHGRLRGLVNQAFTPRRVSSMIPTIRATTEQLLDQLTDSAELIEQFALPLPVRVICDLLGIPRDDQDDVADWSQAIISPGSRGLTFSARKRKTRQFVNYLRDLFEQRRQVPADDLISALVAAEEAGDRLSEAELSSMVALLLVTGHETTVNLIGNGTLALLRNPQQLALLRDRPELLDDAIEELLRYDGPVETSTRRWAAADFEYRGQPFKKGQLVRAVITSANRDAQHFVAPDQLNILRANKRHLQFGLGIHYCLGATLARLEGKIALDALFGRFPDLHLAVPDAALQWRSGVLFRGLHALPVRLS